MTDWISPRLGIRLVWQGGEALPVFYPDGTAFLSTLEVKEQAERAAVQATQAQLRADHTLLQQAEEERRRAEAAELALAQERDRFDALQAEWERLRSQNP